MQLISNDIPRTKRISNKQYWNDTTNIKQTILQGNNKSQINNIPTMQLISNDIPRTKLISNKQCWKDATYLK